MNDKKLKPEHRKLWRRIYLDSFEGDGTSPEEAERMADKVVTQWERRGAFDDDADTSSVLTESHAWQLIATTLREKHPDVFEKVFAALREDRRSVDAWDEIVRIRDAKPQSFDPMHTVNGIQSFTNRT